MSSRTVLVGVLALILAGSAAIGVNSIQSGAGPAADSVDLLIASDDVPRGELLGPEKVTTRRYPRDLAPAGAITKSEDAVGRVTSSALTRGEVLLEAKLATKGSGRGLAALIPLGMRAFTIQTPNVATGVAGFIMPGNRVDVLLTVAHVAADDATGGGSTTTLLQYIEILAVDQRMEAPAENKVDPKELRSVTLLVTPDDAAKLDLGQNRGLLHLSLRNPKDDRPAKTSPAMLSDLRYSQKPPQPPAAAPATPAAPAPYIVRTLRGSSESRIWLAPPGQEDRP